jgi:hypothetical protein
MSAASERKRRAKARNQRRRAHALARRSQWSLRDWARLHFRDHYGRSLALLAGMRRLLRSDKWVEYNGARILWGGKP